MGGETSRLPPPTELLGEDHRGPAHELIRRCVARDAAVPLPAVLFQCPLRARGRHPKGSDLLDRRTLRQLLTWPAPHRRPDLAIVLVDQDGAPDRRMTLRQFTEGISLPVAGTLATKPPNPPAVEGLQRREAKSLLDDWIETSGQEARLTRLTL